MPHGLQRITKLCANNKESLEVSFMELSKQAPSLANYVADAPAQMLRLFGAIMLNEGLRLGINISTVL